jgi:dTDP-glucose 4,6-dehydratase
MRLDDGRVVPNFLQQAIKSQPLTIYGDGSQTRSFCYVSDLIQGINQLLLSDEHLPVNMGNPNEITISEFAAVINRAVGNNNNVIHLPASRLGDDPQRRKPDITRAKELLRWEPTTSLEKGLHLTIPYFRARIGDNQ